MRAFLKGLAWVVWWVLTRAACASCIALAWHYLANGGLLPGAAWLGLFAMVCVIIVLVED